MVTAAAPSVVINRSRPGSISLLTLESGLLMESSGVELILGLVQPSPGHPLPEHSCPVRLHPACPKARTALDVCGPCTCSPRVWVRMTRPKSCCLQTCEGGLLSCGCHTPRWGQWLLQGLQDQRC